MKINEFIPNTSLNTKLNSVDKKNNKEKNITGFADTLKSKLDEVNDKIVEADKKTERFIKGEDVDIHEVTIKTTEAKLSLQLAVEIRNKLMEAYQELNRMQV
ncbi:flagellar hook-basal body complex protein FliE [Clostridium ganghwense]|uniref:Flagellar hook-basal body complex protein FliE n=1 Tax=Clostridium ganghwense TaxID=312089 RepID=A0ABT4CPM5_9CLOT|nr:flagellar hook-basal body complex protein FliE [Clostridium ganghwense]MCY6370393.1 flagellar hook-basal body complex protein FliE [Clostridium ganghwense]